MKLDELAAALQTTLRQNAGKPIFPGRRNSGICKDPSAVVNRDGIAVKLNPGADAETLTFEEAKRYLVWLRTGNFGHNWHVENAYLDSDMDK